MSDDLNALRAWIGRSETSEEILAADPALRLHATLDYEGAGPRIGDALPPLWNWLYFVPKPAASEIGTDGHPRRGGFLPPVELPRRMFAGSQTDFHAPLVIGELARRHREVVSIDRKDGRTGSLIFVGVHERIEMAGQLCVEERQTIVYRHAATTPAVGAGADPKWSAVPAGTWTRVVKADPVLMFRFAALTFNAHRIHYDRRYAEDVEGYPGLVVQGPLVALLLVELARQNASRRIARYSFRALAPVFEDTPFRLVGSEKSGTVTLLSERCDGVRTMEAEARLVD